MQTVVVILGPTASGKSALAVELAKQLSAKWGGGEVISADSRQVYRGLDIGSGKITKEETAGIPHHLLDVANAGEQFSVAEYQTLAKQKIAEIVSRGKLPIICGGTGLYIRAIVDDLVLPEVPPDPRLRAELEKESVEQLFERLQKLDPARAETIDAHNPRRLVRAIEIATALGQVPKLKQQTDVPYDFIQIGLNPGWDVLKQKIHTRLISRLGNGMIEEVESLHDAGLSWERLDSFGLEYRYLAQFLQNKLTEDELIKKLGLAIEHYAKRQMTWFKRDPRIKWFADNQRALAYLERQLK